MNPITLNSNKKSSLFVFLLILASTLNAQIKLETDLTNVANSKPNMPYHLKVFNRIHPENGFRSPTYKDGQICLVRPLGGISKEGEIQKDKDSYKWNGTRFVYDFSQLKKQLDRVKNQGFKLYQIVLDNPSWDFQRRADGTLPGGAYKISTYGNAEPPLDYNAWARYLKETMKFIIGYYGRTEALKIQYDIGREIGTKGHWTGTQNEFFRFYKRSVEAIRSELPGAKVGTHFLWGTSRNSWGPDFVRWAKTNNVDYDFVGVSFYPFYNRANRTNLESIYKNDFGVIKDIPEWNKNAKLELHEYSLLETIGSAGNTYTNPPVKYSKTFMISLLKMFYEHEMENIFQWGTGDLGEIAGEFLTIEGYTYHINTRRGTPKSTSNYVNAIYASDLSNDKMSIIAYNYNATPSASITEDIDFVATVQVPSGSSYRYRVAKYNKGNDTFSYGTWKNGTTRNGSGAKSKILLSNSLQTFTFLKYEIEISTNIPSNVAPVVSITSPANNATFEVGQEITLNASASDPDGNLDKVNFKVNGAFYRTDNVRPFETIFTPTEPGTYKIAARAIDKENLATEVFVNITVTEPNLAPIASFLTPDESTLEEGYQELIVTVDASDPNGDDFSVLLKINGQEIRSESVAPYEWGHSGSPDPMETIGLSSGDHLLEAVVTDERGLTTTISKTITVDRVTFTSSKVDNFNFTIFPNPSEKGIFTLNESFDFEVFNTGGELIKSGIGNTIDLSSQTKGVYILQIGDRREKLVH